ncbi:MAG: ribosomal protection-like ABC-F family protein [Flavobacteriales bacterium]
MLDVTKLSVFFSGEYLFKEISFKLNAGDRIGLIGKNGAGKSTLLRLIEGEETYESGSISYSKHIRIATLKQDLDFDDNTTLWKEAEKAFESLLAIESELEELNMALATREDYESEAYAQILDRVGHLNEQLNYFGAAQKDAEIAKILEGLGFKQSEWEQETSSFSGGWRMRIELAKLLLKKPDILLLDEPTNHLDMESIIWLEKFLKTYPGAVMLVSHDKAFLNAVCNRSIEIQSKKIYDFKGNYDKYLSQRALLFEQQSAAITNQIAEKKRLKELIEKFRYKKSKAAFAQTLIRKLEKMDELDLDVLSNKTMHFKFPKAPHSGKVVLKIDQLSKAFGTKKVLNTVDFELERGQKVALIGQNGQGKTTLVKCIMNQWTDFQGDLKLGHQVEVAYFAQDQAKQLDPTKTVLDTILDKAPMEIRPKVRGLLGSFLFEGEDVDKKVSVLSGGERGRLALCSLMLKPHNLLILDEPTNHLDMQSKDILKEAIKSYEGSVLLISHDREFLDGLTEQVLEFRESKVRTFLGNVGEYLKHREFESLKDAEKTQKIKVAEQASKPEGKASWASDKERKKLKNKISKLERQIEELEESIASKQKELADLQFYEKQEIEQQLFIKKLKQEQADLETSTSDWEQTVERLEAMDDS